MALARPCLRALRRHVASSKEPPSVDGTAVTVVDPDAADKKGGDGTPHTKKKTTTFSVDDETGYRPSAQRAAAPLTQLRAQPTYLLGPVALLLREQRVSDYVAACASYGWRPVAAADRADLSRWLAGDVDTIDGLEPSEADVPRVDLTQPAQRTSLLGEGGADEDAGGLPGGSTAIPPGVISEPGPDGQDPFAAVRQAFEASFGSKATSKPLEPQSGDETDGTDDADGGLYELTNSSYIIEDAYAAAYVPGMDFRFAVDVYDRAMSKVREKEKAAEREERRRKKEEERAEAKRRKLEGLTAAADATKTTTTTSTDDGVNASNNGGKTDGSEEAAGTTGAAEGVATTTPPAGANDAEAGIPTGRPEESVGVEPPRGDTDDDNPAVEAANKNGDAKADTVAAATTAAAGGSRGGEKTTTGNVTRHTSSSSSSKPSRPAEPYVIVVPSATTSMLTLLNAADFLGSGAFVSNAEKRRLGAKRETHVTIERRRPDGVLATYKIVDNPTRLAESEWQRLVAVFAQGPTWQFKGWRHEEPVELFHRVLGVHLKFDDEQTHENITHWNVKVLTLSKTKRHLDQPVALDFWRHLDDFRAKRKAEMAAKQHAHQQQRASGHRRSGSDHHSSGQRHHHHHKRHRAK